MIFPGVASSTSIINSECDSSGPVKSLSVYFILLSTPSIYFDSYAVYNKQESKYNLTKVSLNNTQTRGSKISFTNKTLLSLTVSKHTGLDGHGVAQYESQNVSVLDVSSETVLGTSYDGTAVNINTNTMSTTTGALKFNLQPATYIMVNTVKLYVSPRLLRTRFLPWYMPKMNTRCSLIR